MNEVNPLPLDLFPPPQDQHAYQKGSSQKRLKPYLIHYACSIINPVRECSQAKVLPLGDNIGWSHEFRFRKDSSSFRDSVLERPTDEELNT